MRPSTALVALSLGCGAALPPAPAPSELRYEVAPAPDLGTIGVRICAEGAWPEHLLPMHRDGAARLLSAVPDGAEPLPAEAPLPTGSLPRGSCLTLSFSLAPSRSFGRSPVLHRGEAVVAPTSAWLWGPADRAGLEARARFTLPPGVSRSAVFGDGDTTPLDEPSFHFVSYVAFGALTHQSIEHAAARLEVASLDGGLGEETTQRWARSALEALGTLGVPSLGPIGVVVVPMDDELGDDPVFGAAAHGTIPTVLLLVRRSAGAETLARDWAFVHELVHLTLPHLDGESAWLTEGIATYYQEVLRARAGIVTPEEAWRALDAGFRRGVVAGPGTLRDASAAMDETHAYGRIYGSGAALALLLDVTLRAEGRSLDQVLACATEVREAHVTDEALALLFDGGRPGVATEVLVGGATADRPPDLTEAYAALGLVRSGTGLSLTGEAALRDAIMNGRPAGPSVPVDCPTPRGVSSGPVP